MSKERDKHSYHIYYQPYSSSSSFQSSSIKYTHNSTLVQPEEIITGCINPDDITDLYIVFTSSESDSDSSKQSNSIYKQKKLKSMLIIKINSSNQYKNGSEGSNKDLLDINDLLIGKIALTQYQPSDEISYPILKVLLNGVIRSNYNKISCVAPLIKCLTQVNIITVVDDNTSLDVSYMFNAKEYMDAHPTCGISYPQIVFEEGLSASTIWHIPSIFYDTYNQIVNYSTESLLGYVVHPRYETYTIRKEVLIKAIEITTISTGFEMYLSHNSQSYISLQLYGDKLRFQNYFYSHYNKNTIALMRYPDSVSDYVDMESAYFSGHISSYMAVYSKAFAHYHSTAKSGSKVLFTLYWLISIVPRIVSVVLPAILIVLYANLLIGFNIGTSYGVTVSTIVYAALAIILMSSLVTRVAKWIILVALATMVVLNSIMVGLHIKYIFCGPIKAIPIAGYVLLAFSYVAISLISISVVKFNIVKYAIGLVLHPFLLPVHGIFFYCRSLLYGRSVNGIFNKELLPKEYEVRKVVGLAIILLNICVFCIFKIVDCGDVSSRSIILIDILSYYFLILSVLRLLLVGIYQIISMVNRNKVVKNAELHSATADDKIKDNVVQNPHSAYIR